MCENICLKFDGFIENAVCEQEEFKELVEEALRAENGNSKRTKVICEMYQTEVSYLLQLETLIKFFILPLKTNPLVPETYLNLLFGNIFQLYEVNRKLLEAIKENPGELCHAFCKFAPYLKLYSIYAFGYKKALEILEGLERKHKKFYEFLRCQATRPEVGASLISLLIAPVQRVPRYRLLLQSLLDSTPESHPQYAVTKDALLKAEETALHINKLMTEAEEGEAMVRLARRLSKKGDTLVIPGRKILKQGVLMKTSKNGARSQQRFVVLFTDALLCCKGGEKGPLSLSRLLPLRHLQAEPALGDGLFKVTRGEDCLLLYTADADQGREWLSAILDAVNQHTACQKTLRKDSSKRALRVRGIVNIAKTQTALLTRHTASGSKRSAISKLLSLKRLQSNRRRSIKP